jgi:hypothetical protein
MNTHAIGRIWVAGASPAMTMDLISNTKKKG